MIRHLRFGLALTLLAIASPATAQDAVAIDPLADQVLRQMGDYLGSLEHFRVHAEAASDEEIDTGQLVAFGHHLDMVVRRPDRLWAEVSGDIGHKRILYDGRTALCSISRMEPSRKPTRVPRSRLRSTT